MSGYPLDETLVTNSGRIASAWATTHHERGTGHAPVYLGDFTTNPGNSGGPVYLIEDASVIGVHVAGRLTPIIGGEGLQKAGLTEMVPVSFVARLLDRNDVTWQQA